MNIDTYTKGRRTASVSKGETSVFSKGWQVLYTYEGRNRSSSRLKKFDRKPEATKFAKTWVG